MLAIAGGKGGGGKTTTTLGLAAALDRPVVAVDADVDMPNLHALAGVDRTPTLAAVGGERSPRAVAHPHPDRDGVSVLPAPVAGEDGGIVDADTGAGADAETEAETETDHARTGETAAALGRRLARLRERDANGDAVTLVDCPAGAGPDAATPLRVADAAVVVASPCAPALRDAAKTAAMARALGTPVAGAVLTRARATPPGVSDLLGAPVVEHVPPASPPVLDAPAVEDAYRHAVAALGDRVEPSGNAHNAFVTGM